MSKSSLHKPNWRNCRNRQLPSKSGWDVYWLPRQTFAPYEIAIRFHHCLVLIHPSANGNGRHARLMADVLAQEQDRPVFTLGGTDIVQPGDPQLSSIDALPLPTK